MNLKVVSAVSLIYLLFGCGNSENRVAHELLEKSLNSERLCLLGSNLEFPMIIADFRPDEWGGPILNELVDSGLLTSKAVSENINHNPRKPDNYVPAKQYEFSKKGIAQFKGAGLCYGNFKIKDLDIEDFVVHNNVERRVVRYTYEIENVPDWAMDIENLSYLSTDLFDDLYTLKIPGIGNMMIMRRPGEEWRTEKNNIRLERASENSELNAERNNWINMREAENYHKKIILAESEGVQREEILEMCDFYLAKYPFGVEQEALKAKRVKLGKEIFESNKQKEKNDREGFQKIADTFSNAVDNRNVDLLNSVTKSGTVANRALRNRVFRRIKVGDLSLKEIRFSGRNNDQAQIQTAGNVYMFRLEFLGDAWFIVDYATKGGL